MKCKFCGAEVKLGERCKYCGSVAEPFYYSVGTTRTGRNASGHIITAPEMVAKNGSRLAAMLHIADMMATHLDERTNAHE
jgi:hypothetical protein